MKKIYTKEEEQEEEENDELWKKKWWNKNNLQTKPKINNVVSNDIII